MEKSYVSSAEIIAAEQEAIIQTYKRFPAVLTKGMGAEAFSPEGKRYLDLTSGIGVNALGYCDPEWVAAVSRQAATLNHTSNLYYTQPCAELAQKLTALSGMKGVFFGNSGAEANEGMIKVARKYSFDRYGEGRNRILCLQNSFHGRTVTTLAATGQDSFHTHFFPFTEGFAYLPAGDKDALNAAMDGTVCGIMVEMIQGEGGVVPLDAEYIQAVAALCQEKDILLLVDEVQTGIGRTGKVFSFQHYGVTPDCVSLAKGLGGGLPIGAVMVGEKCKETLSAGTHGSTFGGNPIVCAGALAVLDRIAEEAFLEEVSAKGELLRSLLEELPQIKEVRGKGLMLGAVVQEGLTAGQIAGACVEAGLLILTAKTLLRFLPPLTITEEELREGVAILAEVLKAAEQAASAQQ